MDKMAHITVLFSDFVGFSNLYPERQVALVKRLSAKVTYCLYDHLSVLDQIPDVISLPTGDGIAVALVHKGWPWNDLLFRLIYDMMECSRQESAGIRIGVHVGEAFIITDINRRPNICGSDINICQRIMDAASSKQVLFSDRAHTVYACGPDKTKYTATPFSLKAPAYFDRAEIVAKHDTPILVHVMHRGSRQYWNPRKPLRRKEALDQIDRTEMINERLKEALASKDRPIIYERSTFSTFGIIEDENTWRKEHNGYNARYFRLLMEQKELFKAIAKRADTKVLLIISAELSPSAMRQSMASAAALLQWMKDLKRADDRIGVVIVPFLGENRLIINDYIIFDGLKRRTEPGYGYTKVEMDPVLLEKRIQEFQSEYEHARKTQRNPTVIAELEKLVSNHTRASKRPGPIRGHKQDNGGRTRGRTG